MALYEMTISKISIFLMPDLNCYYLDNVKLDSSYQEIPASGFFMHCRAKATALQGLQQQFDITGLFLPVNFTPHGKRM